jgi:hypothetical protein
MVRYLKGMSDRHPAEEETAMPRFIDKVILITGAAERMSRDIALAFAKEGAIVVLTDINALVAGKDGQRGF